MKKILCLLVILLSASLLFAFGTKEHQRVEISGMVRLVGNSPFYELVITDKDDIDWTICEKEAKGFSHYQQQWITVSGKVKTEDLVLADGKKIGTIRTLSKVKLVRLEALPEQTQ